MTLPLARYHGQTSYQRYKMKGHDLDWNNQPDVYKTYPNAQSIALPKDAQFDDEPFSSVLFKDQNGKNGIQAFTLKDLSRIFFLTYSLTAKARQGAGSFYYRSVASAGALYPTEIYLAAHGVHQLNHGLYHFSIATHSLSILRKGPLFDPNDGLAGQGPGSPVILSFLLSAIFFRSAWKYRERAYRYHLLDTGHVVENLTLALKSQMLPFEVSYDFDDHAVNRLLALDDNSEVSLAIVGVPRANRLRHYSGGIEDLPDEIKAASRVAKKESVYPAIQHMHMAGMSEIRHPRTNPDMINELVSFKSLGKCEII